MQDRIFDFRIAILLCNVVAAGDTTAQRCKIKGVVRTGAPVPGNWFTIQHISMHQPIDEIIPCRLHPEDQAGESVAWG